MAFEKPFYGHFNISFGDRQCPDSTTAELGIVANWIFQDELLE